MTLAIPPEPNNPPPPPSADPSSCVLCEEDGGEVLWRDHNCRIVLVGDAQGAAFAGFCRLIWGAHVREMSDLEVAQRHHLWRWLDIVERAVRASTQADKINLASLGNVVPHLHWHIIPRWRDDSHFPDPIWAPPQRPAPPRAPLQAAALRQMLLRLDATTP